MTIQEVNEALATLGLGGMGWFLFFLTAWELKKSRADHIALLCQQKKEALEQVKLLEQRLFDLKSASVTRVD